MCEQTELSSTRYRHIHWAFSIFYVINWMSNTAHKTQHLGARSPFSLYCCMRLLITKFFVSSLPPVHTCFIFCSADCQWCVSEDSSLSCGMAFNYVQWYCQRGVCAFCYEVLWHDVIRFVRIDSEKHPLYGQLLVRHLLLWKIQNITFCCKLPTALLQDEIVMLLLCYILMLICQPVFELYCKYLQISTKPGDKKETSNQM